MANYICYPLTKVPEHLVEKVKVPTGATYKPGDIVLAETLASTTSNREVYTGAAIGTVASEYPAIVLNQGVEQLTDGRRPDGNPDLSQITFAAGETCTVVRLDKHLKFFISDDSVNTTVAPGVGKVLVPKTATNTLEVLASAVGTEATILNIEKLGTQGHGGLFGFQFVSGMVVRVIKA